MIIGHRGARASAPENTLAAIREAARQGSRMVELDVKLTRDGVAILMHDETLTATTGFDRAVADTDFAGIAELDTLPPFLDHYPEAGRAFLARHGASPVRVPTLAQVLALAIDLDIALNLEIKPCPGRAVETAAVAIEVVRRIWPARRPPPWISSFAAASLDVARRTEPHWPRGLLLDRIGPDWRDRIAGVDAAFIGVNAARLTAEHTATLCGARRPVLAWTVNRPARARQLWRWGVTGIFTDRPAALMGLAQPIRAKNR